MKYKVKTTAEADADVRSTTLYLYSHSPRGAAAWMQAYVNALKSLQTNADGCSVAEENDDFETELKQAFFKTRRGIRYRLIFRIEGNQVQILRVRGPGQAKITPDDISWDE